MRDDKKIPIFLSYSFDKTPPEWSTKSDVDIAKWFETLLKNNGFYVLSGLKAESRPILDKVFEALDQSRAVIALFTGKYQISSMPLKMLPSQWVLCECAYAQGRFRDSDYIVAGFREKGVSPSNLASITEKGMEIPEFERGNLDRDKDRFVEYLNDLKQRILYGPTKQKSLIKTDLPFVQTRLHKIMIIYRNGYCTTQNINELSIRDPEEFSSEYKGHIHHHMWNCRRDFPQLETMMQNAIHRRKVDPFFYSITNKKGNKRLNTPLRVEVERHDNKDIYFRTTFLDEKGEPLTYKYHDTIKYQYAWGLPGMYPIQEEELTALKGEEIDGDTYCIAEAEASRGAIDDFTFELRFERQSRGDERGELFSKNPIYQVGRATGTRVIWTTPRTVDKGIDVAYELDMWYEIYRLHFEKFDGRVRICWRPSSQKYSL